MILLLGSPLITNSKSINLVSHTINLVLHIHVHIHELIHTSTPHSHIMFLTDDEQCSI